ncbi:MAG: DUF2283 domain-containing protein [Hydrogenobacter thermophilus]|uniref:DUF2283 domain-containing protein n=1 Tax=Hydrogenobacter thermophilus TaxID=940 RepID=UPI000CB36C32|nr:DUF2283 domain-containing protein [Hydrogenobacter thermophilus]QWK20740.1 MAG: DUF2283 domain-containing protein [Hydrogenobacter thermophilus]GBC88771.1 hypothetical protein HRbin13_00901 [bacterium HR13]
MVYDPEVDALTIILVEDKAEESEEVLPNVIFDYSKDGKVISIEILKAKKTLEALENLNKLLEAVGRP